jgi:long-chain acyl-CoA synthetase
MWREAASLRRSNPPFLAETPDGWRAVGWDEAATRVDGLAAGFAELGIRKGDRVAILSRTRLEWTLCDFALASLGAVSVPIYQTSSREECAHIVADSGARALVCEDGDQLAKVAGLEQELAALDHLVLIDPAPGALALDELATRTPPSESEVAPGDLLTFIYTSGTTGPPKGASSHTPTSWPSSRRSARWPASSSRVRRSCSSCLWRTTSLGSSSTAPFASA